MQTLLWIPLLTAVRCLWIRRPTWPSKWDGSATNSILLLTVNVLMMTPAINLRISPYLHEVFGVWNLEQLFGHMCYLGALMGFIAMGAMRMDLTERQLQKYLRRNIQQAGAFIVPVAVALFAAGGGEGSNIGDLVLHRPGHAMYPYWIFLGISSLYLSAILIDVLKELRRNPLSRLTCNLYLAGCYLSMVSIVIGSLVLITPAAARPMWIDIRLELMAFSIAATVSWKRRVSGMRGTDRGKQRWFAT